MRRAAEVIGALRLGTRFAAGGLRFRGLGRDYWPADARAPYGRAAFGVALTPAAAAAFFAALGWTAEALNGEPIAQADAYAGEVFVSMIGGLYDLAYAPTLAAFVMLWSLRLRSVWAYLAAGLVSGAATAAMTARTLGYFSVDVTAIVILLNLALLVGARLLCGVRDRTF